MAVKRYKEDDDIQISITAAAKAFLEIRQRELYVKLFEECNTIALYLPKAIAHEVAGKTQRRINHLVHIGTEKTFKTTYLIDLLGHVPPFVLDAVRTLESSGILKRIFDFVSHTSKPPPIETAVPLKPTMEGNILVIFIVLFGGLGISAFIFCGENYKVICRWMWHWIVKCGKALRNVFYTLRKLGHRTKVFALSIKK